jgi:beta propeller repeat protein
MASRCAAGLLLLLLPPWSAPAQEQQQGICADVKIVISQQLTLERIGFRATLQITDNDPNDPITDFAANLTFENPALSTNGTVNDSSALFFVQPPTLQNVANVNGTGAFSPGQTATITWFIIPTTNAGGMNPNGIVYNVGCSLSGKLRGVVIPSSTLMVYPAPITVHPDAQLDITYFTPRDVTGLNPFTPGVVQSPIPFTFGVLVRNVGYGTANSVIINSQQPRIVQNVQNLPLIAQLLGSRVNDSPLSNANLTVNLGDLAPGHATKGAWDMICSISGTFTSVSATYTHSTALGGAETSLIQSVNAYLFLHEVLDDLPGRDNIRDFLTDTSGSLDSVNNLIPDSLYDSDGGVYPVNFETGASVTGTGNPIQVNLNATFTGWDYIRLNDPMQALLPIVSVVRSDGKVLNTNNFWTSIHYEPGSNFKDTYLNLFDYTPSLGACAYTVTYGPPVVSTNPPVTTLMFDGSSTFTNGVYFVTPETQVYFISQDVAPVSMFYSLTNGPFQPAYPFSVAGAGQYQLVYYATDANGNQETNHTAALVVAGAASLGFAGVNVPAQPIFAPGDALSIRPGIEPITFQPLPNPTTLNAQVDIFRGVAGWATVAGVPSSPTAGTSASLTVGGNHVDYFMYQLNSGGWSAEQPVSSPINLSGLAPGSNTVSVLGRSQYGTYLDPGNAVNVGWVVDPAAPPTVITGTPATPSQMTSADLTVGGVNVTDYNWTLNSGYYRPKTNVASDIILTNLTGAQQVVSVLGYTNGVPQSTNTPTSVAWTINSLYGYDLSSLPAVRSVLYTNVSGPVTFNWDGSSDAGVPQPPGWYTVRITITDTLGHTNFTVSLAQIGALGGTNLTLAASTRGPRSPHARGRWAVWQDQSDGNWEIYARDLTASNGAIVQVTHTPLSQENPRTDGRYVVWQAQQTNGTWTVYWDDLDGANGPQAVTSTPAGTGVPAVSIMSAVNEVNPAIDWPWVVYQARSAFNTNAPWQLFACDLATGQTVPVSVSSQDEVAPDVQAGRVVWQDFRNVGPGQIYFSDLSTGQARRLSTSTFGQYNPAISGNWIVWADNRNSELDIWGFDLLRNREIQITDTPEDESQPCLNGPWVLCQENSLGPQTGNARLIHLPSLLTVPVTGTATLKSFPALADGWAVWQETVSNQTRIAAAALPALQPVFQNRNLVAVTPAMAAYATNAYGLLALWGANGVQQITQYTSLTPQVASQTAVWTNGAASGANFNLVAGAFLEMKFNRRQVLDLGVNNSSALNLAAGANVFGCTAFPDGYSAFQLLRQLGTANALSVRMLDAQSGSWLVADVQDGAVVGNDFPIPTVAILMVNMAQPVQQFTPQAQ